MPEPIVIPQEVLDGLEAVRRSGLTNMLDRPVVAELAESFGFREAAEWVRGHRKEYAGGAEIRRVSSPGTFRSLRGLAASLG